MSEENTLILTGIDGSNPLGFLAALGTLHTLTYAWPDHGVKMRWIQHSGAWRPEILIDGAPLTHSLMAETVARHLRCGFETAPDLEKTHQEAQKVYEKRLGEIKKLQEEIKNRGLKAKECHAVEDIELQPHKDRVTASRAAWLNALAEVVPFGEMRLGKHLDSTHDEFREVALGLLEEADPKNRESIDALAAFASDACFDEKTQRIAPTPLCFTTGSGHQYFLDTARKLVGAVTEARIVEALFSQWIHRDERLSMRWDPKEDRRYALMWMDPTDSKNKAVTNWAANLLAYRGVAVFTSIPTVSGLRTRAFRNQRIITWPLWDAFVSVDVVQSLLGLVILNGDAKSLSTALSRGVCAAFQAERLVVGTPPNHKYNFSPAKAVV